MLSRIRKALNSVLGVSIVLAILVFLAVYAARQQGWLQPLELVAYDWLLRTQSVRTAPPRVTVVTITEQDIQTFGKWPIPNDVLADALERIVAEGPRAVGIDIYTDIPIPPGRERLEAVMLSNPRIVAAMRFPRGGEPGIPPPSVLADTGQFAFTDWIVDPKGILRRGLLILDDGVDYVFSLPFQLALHYLSFEGVGVDSDPDIPEYMRIGGTTIPPLQGNFGGYRNVDDGGYQFMLGYRQDVDSIPEITLEQLVAGEFDPSLIQNRIVLIGVTAESVKDFFYTPYSGTETASAITAGVVMHAYAASELLGIALDGEQPVKSPEDWMEAAWALFWSLCGGLLGMWVRAPSRFALSGIAGLALIWGAAQLALGAGWWIPFVPPALTWLITATMVTAFVSYREMQERDKLMQLFSRHVAKEVAEDIWENRDQFLSGGHPKPQKLMATVFFSDLVSFSTISEELDPPTLMDWLNDYMSIMTPVVNHNDGVILRFIGDAIMAAYGVPVPRQSEQEMDRDAVNAVESALAMQDALIELNRKLEADGKPLIAMRVGIFTGPMVAGSVGDSERIEYTVYGDTVNTAARLEAYAKDNYRADYFKDPCRIYVGQPTYERLGGRFETECVGDAKLKGKEQITTVYRVMGRALEVDARKADAA